MTGSETWDLVVAGGGASGLVTALAAGQSSLRTLVAEKAARTGGAANISAGFFWAPPTLDILRQQIREGRKDLQAMLVDRFAADMDWLEAAGLPLGEWEGTAGGFGKGRAMGTGTSGDRFDFMTQLADMARGAGVEIRCNAPLEALDVSGSGWRLRVDGIIMHARAVVLATGGFQSNSAMLARHMGGDVASALRLRSITTCNGDAIKIATELGAATDGDFTAFYGHTMPDMEIAAEDLQPLTPYFASHCVMVNRLGRRFVDESESLLEEVNPQQGCRQPGGRYFLLFDEALYRRVGIDQGVTSAIPTLDRRAKWREQGAPIYSASTVTALADLLNREEGVARNAFMTTLDVYNRSCRDGRWDPAGPARQRNRVPLGDGPVYALRCAAGITCTMAGLHTDAAGRVLNSKGDPLPGLYSVGNDVGGLFRRRYAGYLAWALVSGRAAAQSITVEISGVKHG